jgi:probable rRNA maturation factor
MKQFIDIVYEDPGYEELISRREITSWIRKTCKYLNILGSSCSLFLTSDSTIRNINSKYLKNKHTTDVISFSQIEGVKADHINSGFIGDIVISIDTAKKQSSEMGHSLKSEIFLLLLHGILHILGYDHVNKKDTKMIKLQNKIYYDLTGDKIA